MDTKRFNLDTTLTLIAAYLGLFVGLIDANAINLAMPAIRDSLGGGISGAQWTIDVYNITFAAVLLTAGSLGDRHGRRCGPSSRYGKAPGRRGFAPRALATTMSRVVSAWR